ncbi:MAG: MJ0042-type zinc finger domain-containing protein, partial [Woeseiaceae bacterium]
MYTECPECGTAFRVTAKVLQQARGNVRCGGCNNAFNALEYLSEEMPGTGSIEEPEAPVDELAETSRRLLQTLDDLAGPEEVRIEDTGVEWRVLEEIESGIDVDESDDADEPRYDDNSPLPDDIGEEDEPAILLDSQDQGDDDDAAEAQPQRRLSDTHFSVEFNEMQGDLALADPEEWDDLLDEVRDSGPDSIEVEEELASIHSQLATGRDNVQADAVAEAEAESEAEGEAEGEAEADEVELADIDTQFNLQAEALGLDLVGREDALTDEVPLLPEDTETPDASPDDDTSAADSLKTRESDIPYAEPSELPDHRPAADTKIATQTESSADEAHAHDSGDDSQTEISDALLEELDENAETGINKALSLSEDRDGTSETGINAALQEDLDEDFVTGINEALAEDFDENAVTGINETLQDNSADADNAADADNQSLPPGPDGAEAVDTEADRDRDDEPEATAASQSADQDDDVAAAGEGKILADVIRESSGEFEA